MSRLRGRVVTVSDRVAAGVAGDRSGPLATALLADHGVSAPAPAVVPDDPTAIAGAVRSATDEGLDVLVLTGGTGIGPRDRTPEAVEPLLERLLPGVGEAVRAASRDRIPTADLSRTLAGTIGSTLVLVLPGSTGGVRDGLNVAGPLIPHAVHVLTGGDHERPTEMGAHATVPPPAHAGLEPGDAEPAATGSPSAEPAAMKQAPPAGLLTAHGPAATASGVVVRCEVTEAALDETGHAREVAGPDVGAVVSFAGTVRDHDHGRAVRALTYEAHPTAGGVLAEVAADVARRIPVTRLAVSHRVGPVPIGEAALVVAASSPHRGEALRACAALVDEVKARLPVWKHQVFTDGSDEWVNCA